jgi:hypothetical protein
MRRAFFAWAMSQFFLMFRRIVGEPLSMPKHIPMHPAFRMALSSSLSPMLSTLVRQV